MNGPCMIAMLHHSLLGVALVALLAHVVMARILLRLPLRLALVRSWLISPSH
ncbi:MAG: hypothetical protein ACLPTF_25265 [Steroidobacteraceae bacterium]